jgi:hypothetical protein
MNRMPKFIFVLILLPLIGTFCPANASDGCGFGNKNESNQSLCTTSVWEQNRINNGFESYFSIEMEADTDASINAEAFNSLSLRCQKKKVRLFVFMDGYLDTTDFKFLPDGSLVEYGKLALKIDNGKTLSWGWKRSFSDQIELNNPEKVISLLAKAKEQFTFKIARGDSPSIMSYPKSDFIKYRKQFVSLGCKY